MEYEKGLAHIWREAQRRRGDFLSSWLRQIWLRLTYRIGAN